MLVETYKLITSVLPFVKEAFLWRDGAEVGKPITKQNLIRRKIAVFVLIGSLVVNYLALDRVYKFYQQDQALQSELVKLQQIEKDLNKALIEQAKANASCVRLSEVLNLCELQVEDQILKGSLIRPKRPPHR